MAKSKKTSNAVTKTPLVSVIMPVYNADNYLAEAIESILKQTYKNFEFIIVDDASTDTSKQIIQKYANKDRRIRSFFSKSNQGEAAARNLGFSKSRGEYIAVMDADDISDKKRLSRQVDYLDQHQDTVILGSNISIMDSTSVVYGERHYTENDQEIRKEIGWRSPFAHPTIMMRQSTLEQTNGYDEGLLQAPDYDLWFRLLRFGSGHNLQEKLLIYRVHDSNSKANTKRTLDFTTKIQRRYLFDKTYFNFKALLLHSLHYPLMLVPNRWVLKLFKLTSIKNGNG